MAQSKSTLEALKSGKFLTVQWIKANGEVRTESARFGVKKYLKGTGKARHNPQTHVLLWCREIGGLRFNRPRLVARDKILVIKAEGFYVASNPRSDYAKIIRA